MVRFFIDHKLNANKNYDEVSKKKKKEENIPFSSWLNKIEEIIGTF